MTAKVAKSFYATAIGHREIPGAYLAAFAIPGEPPQWVMESGQAKLFTGKNAKMEAELAGFKVLVSKLNKAHDVQEFVARKSRARQPRVFHAPAPPKTGQEHTIDSVFGKKK